MCSPRPLSPAVTALPWNADSVASLSSRFSAVSSPQNLAPVVPSRPVCQLTGRVSILRSCPRRTRPVSMRFSDGWQTLGVRRGLSPTRCLEVNAAAARAVSEDSQGPWERGEKSEMASPACPAASRNLPEAPTPRVCTEAKSPPASRPGQQVLSGQALPVLRITWEVSAARWTDRHRPEMHTLLFA